MASLEQLAMLYLLLGVVEVVACHKLTYHLVAAIAQSAGGFQAHLVDVEHQLLAAPACREAVAYARILVEVEALEGVVIHHLWRSQTMEIVDHQYLLRG